MRRVLLLVLTALASAGGPARSANNAGGALLGADLLKTALSESAEKRVEFVGANFFPEEELLATINEEVAEFTEKGLTPARGDDTAYFLGSFYRKSGFAKVDVDYQIRGRVLVLKVSEGPRSLVTGVNFTGNGEIPEATLWEYFLGTTPEKFAKTPDMIPYNTGDITAGADRVRGLYISEGYLNATVDASQVALSQNGTRAAIAVHIVSGRRYTFGHVRFVGRTLYPEAELIKAMGEPVNGPFSATKVTNAQRNLQSFYKARGHYRAEVAVTADPAQAVGGRVAVRFDVKPGNIFRIGEVTVQGTDRLKESFLPKRFAHLRGEIYDPAKLDETFREMLRTGLFRNLRISPTPVGTDELRIDLTVEEAKAREVGFTIGAGSYEGASVGLRLVDRNLFGNGRPLSLAVDYSQRGLQGELLYVDPWLLDSRFRLRAKLYSASRTEEGYSKTAVGWRTDLSRLLLPHLEVGAFIEQAAVKVTSDGIDPLLLGPMDYFLTSVGLTTTVDFRDDPINPSRGLIFSNSLDFSTIDGEPAFTRATMRLSYYLPLGRFLLAFGARAGLIEPINDSSDIPIDLRYFNGGGNSVRSFAERELGPKSRSGDPIAGELFTVFNTEFTFPIVGALKGAAFLDAGNLTSSGDLGFSDMRYAVGLGLRYQLPIGPLRLDYGVNPSPRADESRGAFHFSFGFAF